jgi:hypothetical protein
MWMFTIIRMRKVINGTLLSRWSIYYGKSNFPSSDGIKNKIRRQLKEIDFMFCWVECSLTRWPLSHNKPTCDWETLAWTRIRFHLWQYQGLQSRHIDCIQRIRDKVNTTNEMMFGWSYFPVKIRAFRGVTTCRIVHIYRRFGRLVMPPSSGSCRPRRETFSIRRNSSEDLNLHQDRCENLWFWSNLGE